MANTTSPSMTTTDNEGDDSMTAMQKLREQADAAVLRIQPQLAAVSTYARNEPTKALLMSAAAGAALMGLFALMVRSSGRSPMAAGASALAAGASAMAAIRDAALDLADSAQSMANDALESTQQRAAAAADSVGKRASAAADNVSRRAAAAADSVSAAAESVSEAAADAWKKVRDQAAPVVERVRPQIDAATQYVKEDPARAALGLAAAGAVVAGLLALIRYSRADD
jgi:ElaB/YqjD/DUF883 family membrane-anchored ribosome-binding protein